MVTTPVSSGPLISHELSSFTASHADFTSPKLIQPWQQKQLPPQPFQTFRPPLSSGSTGMLQGCLAFEWGRGGRWLGRPRSLFTCMHTDASSRTSSVSVGTKSRACEYIFMVPGRGPSQPSSALEHRPAIARQAQPKSPVQPPHFSPFGVLRGPLPPRKMGTERQRISARPQQFLFCVCPTLGNGR